MVSITSVPEKFAPIGVTLRDALDGFVDGGAERIGGRVVSRTMTTYFGQLAEDAITESSDTLFRTRVFFVGRRIYIINSVTAAGYEGHLTYDRLLATFRPL